MSKYGCHFVDKLCIMHPWDIDDNNIVLIRDNLQAYQLEYNLSEFYTMHGDLRSPLTQVCYSVEIPEYASEAIRKTFTKKSEFMTTDTQQSDANGTSGKTGDGGNSSSNDAKKSSVEKRVSLADIKKRARGKKALVNDITVEIYDPYDKAANSKTIERKPTGLITNIEESKKHLCVWDPNYPENPNRLQSVIDRFHAYELYNRCEILKPRPARKEEILVAHSQKVHDLLEEYSVPAFQDDFETFSSKYDAVFINESTYNAAIFAAGCCIELVDAIMTNKIQNGFAAVRPPGHHAMHDEYNGYCFFNNAVIAANYSMNKFGTKRILIVDFDVHHGQGTQDHFYKSKNVLYFSIHRYEFGSFWPNLRRSDFDYIGEDDGKGFNFNVPLNEIGMTDADYLTIFNTVLMPVAYEYDPELVIISAGYDAANGCPEGQMKVSPQCYAHMTHLLQAFAQGRVAVLLEGGYNITSLAEGAALTLRALLDDPVPRLPHPHLTPKTSLLKTLRNLILHQKPYWKCFDLYTGVPDEIHTSPEVYTEKLTIYPTRDAYPKVPTGSEGLQIHLEILETITTKIKSYLKTPPFKLLILYDKTMLKHNSRDGTVPLENPSRIEQSFDLLKSFGLLDRAAVIKGSTLKNADAFNKIHSEDYVRTLKDVINSGDDKIFTSIFTNKHTLDCAFMAVGSSINLLDQVMNGDCATALALIRPPGHHAEPNEAMGFCFFNNVAVVAQHALDHYKIKRVLIVDFDIHHPNGTYTIFKNDNRCLLISIHRYHPNFFPHTGEITEFGESDGIGFNVNIPWTQKGQGDLEYLAAFSRIILPISRQFDPELVLVSAGFDAAIGDPLGQCNVSPEMFGHMAHMLKEVSSGRLLFFLEGGYNVTSVSHSVAMVAKALLGDPLVSIPLKATINDDAAQVIDSVIQHQIKYWSILNLDPIKCTPKSKTCVLEVDAVNEPVKNPVIKEESIHDKLFSAKMPYQTPWNTIPDCDHVYIHLQEIPEEGVDIKDSCSECTYSGERRFACLSCYVVGCADQISGHIRKHAFLFDHPIIISYEDLSIYCFACRRYLSGSNLDEYRSIFLTESEKKIN